MRIIKVTLITKIIIIIKILENTYSNKSNYENISINDNYNLSYYKNRISHKSNNYNHMVQKKLDDSLGKQLHYFLLNFSYVSMHFFILISQYYALYVTFSRSQYECWSFEALVADIFNMIAQTLSSLKISSLKISELFQLIILMSLFH